MKIYLDNCVYNRPFDYQGQERVALETGAFIYILEKVEKGFYTVVISEASVYENNKSLDEQRNIRVTSYFQLAKEFVISDGSDIERVRFLKGLGFSDIDALHIVLAEKSKADYFITCDDGIINLYKKHRELIKIKIIGLIEFIGLEVK